MVEIEQSPEALPPPNVRVRADRRWRSLQELVVESLMVPGETARPVGRRRVSLTWPAAERADTGRATDAHAERAAVSAAVPCVKLGLTHRQRDATVFDALAWSPRRRTA